MVSKFLILVFVVLCLGACSSGQPTGDRGSPVDAVSTAQAAESAVQTFYALLNLGNYGQAADLFGGSYDVLVGYNPDLDLTDHAGLLQASCEINGFACLPAARITLEREMNNGSFLFSVEFLNPDGRIFERGPCCDSDEDQEQPVSVFQVEVNSQQVGSYLVLDLPPYVP